jgi:hypothetical protein
VRTILLICIALLASCDAGGSKREGESRLVAIADKELLNSGIDLRRYQRKQIIVGQKRAIISYEDSTPFIMEGQPIVVINRQNGEVLLVHIEQ